MSLANATERAMITIDGEILCLADRLNRPPATELPFARQTLEDVERHHILRILGETGWRIEGPKGADTWLADADPTVSLDAVRRILAKVPGTLAEVVHADREDR